MSLLIKALNQAGFTTTELAMLQTIIGVVAMLIAAFGVVFYIAWRLLA